jgi:hypothetical protein
LAELNDLKNEWVLEGFKNEVETARENILRLGAKSPVLTWAEWREQFNPDLSSETGTDLTRVFLSSFMPSNAIEDGSWRPFNLNEAEVKSLISAASDDLRGRYLVGSRDSSIKSISLEFSSAAIIRPWFEPQMFRSRFWRLANLGKTLSNGTEPLSGDCPAYVTAVVFARSVSVQHKNKAQTPSGKASVNGLRFNFAIKDQRKVGSISPALLKAIKPARLQMLKASTVRKAGPKRLNIKPQAVKKFQATTLTPRFTLNHGLAGRSLRGQARTRVKTPSPFMKAPSKAVLKLQASEFRRFKVKPVVRPVATLAASTVKAAKENDNIYIFAFICKPIPKCPDPDPALVW